MKSKVFILLSFLFFSVSLVLAQEQVITIRLDTIDGYGATVIDLWGSTNFKNDFDLCGVNWSINGQYYKCRSLFKFNLSNIPTGFYVDSAKLSLFGNPSPQHSPGHSTFSGSNACYIKRVISNWTDSTVTWVNQPPTSSVNEITLPESTWSMEDYTGIDVTGFIRLMINNPSLNYGFMIQLQNENPYRSLDFASGSCPDSTKRPKLDIYFHLVGIKPVSSDLPDHFELFQNYPNPFNPGTLISYQLSKTSNVKLVIYDELGREVQTLVNENQVPGIYKVSFDAGNYSSGLYFYKLSAAGGAVNFSEIRKMVLIK